MALNTREHYFEAVKGLETAVKYFGIALLLSIALGLIMPHAAAELVPFNETIPGDRNLGQQFAWIMNNVSGTYAHAAYQFTVYDYRILGNNYSYYSVNWGQWMKEVAEPGNKYLVVWIRGRMDGTTYFGWGQEFFNVWVRGRGFAPEEVKLQDIPIRGSFASSSPVPVTTNSCTGEVIVEEDRIIEGGSKDPISGSKRYQPVVVREVEDLKANHERGQLTTERYGWKDENEMDRMVPGETVEGYILFQVPEDARPEDIQVAGFFRNWGTAVWNLVDREIDQESVERYLQVERVQMDIEREIGIRLPDKPGERTIA